MIQSIEDLQKFTELVAKKIPLLAQRKLLRTPGCSDDEIRELLAFEPDLPPIYLNCIRKLRLKGISLSGSFSLWPGGNVFEGTFAQDFQTANSPGFYHQEEFQKMGLFIAASWNDADVCVAKSNSTLFAADSVVRFDDTDQCESPIVMCQDYEKFLLAAGNVADIFMNEKELAYEERVELLLERLSIIGLSSSNVEGWRAIAELVYED